MNTKWGANRDKNHAEIVKRFRSHGVTVLDTARIGSGFPDIIVEYHGLITLIEIKSENGKLSRSQKAWHKKYSQMVIVIRSVEEVDNFVKFVDSEWNGFNKMKRKEGKNEPS